MGWQANNGEPSIKKSLPPDGEQGLSAKTVDFPDGIRGGVATASAPVCTARRDIPSVASVSAYPCFNGASLPTQLYTKPNSGASWL